MNKKLIITHPEAIVSGKQVQELDKDGTYIISVSISGKKTPEEVQVILNKVELAFKTLGIKNVKAIASFIKLFKVK